MAKTWTFGQKLAAGFAIVVAFAMLIGGVSIYALRTVVASKDRVIAVNAQNLIDAARLTSARDRKSAASRGFLWLGEDRFRDQMGAARDEFDVIIDRLRTQTYTEEGRRLVGEIAKAEADHRIALDRVIAQKDAKASDEVVSRQFELTVVPARDALDRPIKAFVAREERSLEEGRQAATDTAGSAVAAVIASALAALVFAVAVAVVLTRALSRQIGQAVQHVQSSSSELQASANQQAIGSKQQATAMTEITTTISELLATSRQIAESAQRVSQIAAETATAARAGDQTVLKTQESVAGIRRQVDVIVMHMLELGKKSQQIGGVLEIINELAEQTNILAINATIEAAGAGEVGKRFGVVADEIRRLADRVGGSTKEIRALVDDVRAAVNTTVMATESGSKTVDAGTRQFGEVAASFRHIAGLVGTTTEAAREIELSTRQQSSAVEQVNVAVANVAQAAKESEASSSQTLETSSQLTHLSRDLARLTQADAA